MIDVEKIVREYIHKTIHMSLATVSDNKPWVCEVHFAYDDDLNIYWRSKDSTRHSKELRLNPSVAGNIVRQHEPNEYPHAIYFEGVAAIITDLGEQERVALLFVEQQGVEEKAIIEDAQESEGHKFYKVTVKNWYAFGKFGKDSGQKYKLQWSHTNR